MTISDKGLALIKQYEGLGDGDKKTPGLQPYMDPVGIWTIGYGHAITYPVNGRFVQGDEGREEAYRQFPDALTESDADALLRKDITAYERQVQSLVSVPLTQGQFDALVSFQFNTGGLRNSTLLRRLNSGDYTGAANEFARWNKAGGRVLSGLTKRRAAERALFDQA